MKRRFRQSVFLVGAFVSATILLPFSSSAVTLLSEGFEGAFPGSWSRGDANSSGTAAYWADVNSAFGGEGTHGGSWKGYCAGVGFAGTTTSPTYQNSMLSYMSQSINLSGYSSATLTFWYKIPSQESIDKLRVYIGTTKIWENSGVQTSWTQVSLNLNSYVGASRTLKFEFYSDGSVVGEGAYLDDIAVDATASTASEMDVKGNGVSIADGDTSPSAGDWTDFGATPVGTPIERTFYVYNTGTGTLTVGTPIVPSGYTLSVGLASSIPAGGSDWFRVRLNATAAGTYAGDISITSNDSNENPYNFRVTGNVAAAPAPELLVVSVPSTLTLGDWATVTVQVRNNGGTATDGGISVSFPGLAAAGDTANVEDYGSSTGDTLGYREFPQGSSIANKSGSIITAGYMLVEYGDDNWTGSEVNTLTLRVKPKAAGGFTVNIRSAMGANGTYVGSPTSGPTDQQGWWVLQRTITVVAPLPEMDVRGNGVSIADGDTTPSTGDWTDFGTTTVGIPVERTFYVYNTGTGPLIVGTPAVPSGYTLSVGLSSSIPAGGSDWFRVRLNATAAGTYAGDISISNNDGNENPYNFRITGTVAAAPAPELLVVSVPSTLMLGDWATVTVQVRNNGGTATDGGISVSFPGLAAAGDTANVEDFGSTTGDTPGYREFPQGSSIANKSGSQITANCMLVELGDDNWTGSEVNTLTFRVKPKSIGGFTINIRSAMGANSIYVGTPISGPTDQQGWWVQQRTITVTAAEPEMDVRGNSVSIADDDTTPSTGDGTDFGTTPVGTPVERSFYVYNTGTGPLTLGTPTLPSGYTLTIGIASSIPAGGSDWFRVRLNATTFGTYAGDISISNNDSNENPYNFRITGTVAGITADSYEADDSAGAAKTITSGQTQNRNIHAAGNADWIKFTVGGSGTSTLVLETDGTSGDTQMWLFGPNNSSTQVPNGYSDDEGNGAFSRLACGVNGMPATLSPGNYWIKITEYQNDGTIPAYTLRASWTDGGDITADIYEADDSAAAARTISSGQTQNRNIHANGNVDWIKFTVGGAGTSDLVLETDGASGDTQMWLYGPNNSSQQVPNGYSDDEGNGAFSRLACGANGMPATLSPGNYWIKITEYQNDGRIPAYTLRATWSNLPIGGGLDAYEADDTAGAAKTISSGQTQNRNIHAAGNVDWIKFTVGGAGTSTLILETDGASGDTQMWLYGPNNSAQQVTGGYSDDEGNGAFSRLACGVNGMPATLSPGTYWIKITEYQNDGTIAAYMLRATWTDLPVGTTPDAYEADDSAGAAKTITNGQTQNRNIHTAGNVDWIKFTVGSLGTSNLVVETDGASGDTQMWLYGPNNTAQQVPGGYSDDDGNGAFSRLACGVNGMPATLSPGTYWIKVTEYQNDGFIASYTLRTSWTELTTPTITADAYEADDSAIAAKTITNGQTQNRNIHAAGNVDWITFTVGGGGAQNLTIQTDGPSGDTQIWLYGPNTSSQQVPGGYDNDDGNGAFSLLVSGQQSMPATLSPGLYYVKVQENNNDGTIAAYTLRASWVESSAATPLTLSQLVTTLSGTVGSMRVYKVTVPSGQTLLNVQIWGGSGDADLYVRYGTAPTPTAYDYRSRLSGNLDRITAFPVPGDWYIMIYGQAAFSELNLMAKVSQENPADFFGALAESYLGDAVAGPYSSGTKHYAFLGFSVPHLLDWGWVSIVSGGVQMSFDLDDYLQVTHEGITGDWVTMHMQFAYSFVSASVVPFDVGVCSRLYNGGNGLPDREFPEEHSIVNATIGPLRCTYFQFDADGTLTSNLLAGDNPFGFDTWTLNIGFSAVEGLSQSGSIELQRQTLNLATRNSFNINPPINIMGDMLKEQIFHPTEKIVIAGQEYPMPKVGGFRLPSDATDASQGLPW